MSCFYNCRLDKKSDANTCDATGCHMTNVANQWLLFLSNSAVGAKSFNRKESHSRSNTGSCFGAIFWELKNRTATNTRVHNKTTNFPQSCPE